MSKPEARFLRATKVVLLDKTAYSEDFGVNKSTCTYLVLIWASFGPIWAVSKALDNSEVV